MEQLSIVCLGRGPKDPAGKMDRPAEITAIPPLWQKRMGEGKLLIHEAA